MPPLPGGAATTTQLSCLLEGGDENRWHTGDRYIVGGNADALLSLVLDQIEGVLDRLLEESDFLDQELPLIARSPRQLMTKIESLSEQLDRFRSRGQTR